MAHNVTGPVTGIVTGEAVVLDMRTARLASRIVALAVDLTIQVAFFVLMTLLVGAVSGTFDEALVRAVGLTFFVLIVIGYPTLWESLWRGRSPGKAALGLRVVSDDGGPERFRQALFRALAGFVEIWLLLGSVALISSLASRRGKRLGDVFSGTIVVQERMPVRGGPVPWMPPQLAGWATGLELSRLPDSVALMARQYVSRHFELAPAARESMGRDIAATVAAYVSPPPPPGTPPVAYLSAVLVERRRREQIRLDAPPAAYGPAAPSGPMAGEASPTRSWSPYSDRSAWSPPAGPQTDGRPERPAPPAEEESHGGFAPPD
ncbi:MAG: RDD family protein [Streptosporangiaceae bacterium]